MIQAAIFDMDGLMVDTEPLWWEAEKEAFRIIDREMTDEMCRQTTGMRTSEVVEYWYNIEPWKNIPQREIADQILDVVEKLIREKAVPKEGVIEALEFFRTREIPLALASSSPMRLIDVVIDRFETRGYFDVIGSAENEPYGKPHPCVYLTTAQKLGISPDNCVAFEDSFNGLLSAKAAKMKTVAVPESHTTHREYFVISDIQLTSLEEFGEKEFDLLNSL